jgi:hypothetical protein
MTIIKATEVFTPGAFPEKTYVERGGEKLEASLRDAIDTPGQIVSLIGPSKSGKTVLVERVVGRDLLITITGAGITSPDDIWERALDWMGAPASTESSAATSGKAKAEVEVGGSAGVPLVAKGEAKAKAGGELGHERKQSKEYERTWLQQVVKEIAKSEYVLLVDDFHYMPRAVQAEAAKALKEAVRLEVKVCTAAVQHRGDDLVRANPELRGRVRAVDLKYWSPDDLRRIAETGFAALNATLEQNATLALIREAAGSPQLMQLLCLNTCFVLGLRKSNSPGPIKLTPTDEQLKEIFEQTSAATDFRSLVDVIDSGPRTRGTERKLYKFTDGSQGDVYRAVLKAVASDPPRLSFSYDDLVNRTRGVCKGDSPVGSSITGTCKQIHSLALEKFPMERAIDWDEQKPILDLPDPYLLFYLRWSGRLQEPE